ncbi:DsbA family protein [Pseudomonas sp. 2FG]|uniref:DsbA family protein n=1 Tax=Pseudomonas sp. 2FG TaxID=2502191 RepID=UPI0010F57C7C|nr:DsbA family protein [Pseudomonas sp. 2FG]
MSPATLHYIYDPLCGWCYGAAPLAKAAGAVAGLRIALHGGGMLIGANRQSGNEHWRNHVLPHDRRIAALSGQPFGAAYFDCLLRDSGAVFDSAAPTAATLAAEALGGSGLALLGRIQQAHYVEGRRVAEVAVLQELAAEFGLAPEAFRDELQRQGGEPLARHFADSRRLLQAIGGSGFPSFALERDGRFQRLDASRYLGRAEDWQTHLEAQIAGTA